MSTACGGATLNTGASRQVEERRLRLHLVPSVDRYNDRLTHSQRVNNAEVYLFVRVIINRLMQLSLPIPTPECRRNLLLCAAASGRLMARGDFAINWGSAL